MSGQTQVPSKWPHRVLAEMAILKRISKIAQFAPEGFNIGTDGSSGAGDEGEGRRLIIVVRVEKKSTVFSGKLASVPFGCKKKRLKLMRDWKDNDSPLFLHPSPSDHSPGTRQSN